MQITFTPNDSRLVPFLGLAALLHAVVILLVPVERAARAPLPHLRLALAQPYAALSAPDLAPRPPPADIAPFPASRPASPEPSARATAEPLPQAAPAPQEEGRSAEVASARVIAEVRAALTRYFVYPVAARRQGWQGEVLVAFLVTREGRIDNVEVVHSSGYLVLDEAARRSLAQVGTLPNYAPPGGEPVQIRMPVIYRLEG